MNDAARGEGPLASSPAGPTQKKPSSKRVRFLFPAADASRENPGSADEARRGRPFRRRHGTSRPRAAASAREGATSSRRLTARLHSRGRSREKERRGLRHQKRDVWEAGGIKPAGTRQVCMYVHVCVERGTQIRRVTCWLAIGLVAPNRGLELDVDTPYLPTPRQNPSCGASKIRTTYTSSHGPLDFLPFWACFLFPHTPSSFVISWRQRSRPSLKAKPRPLLFPSGLCRINVHAVRAIAISSISECFSGVSWRKHCPCLKQPSAGKLGRILGLPPLACFLVVREALRAPAARPRRQLGLKKIGGGGRFLDFFGVSTIAHCTRQLFVAGNAPASS